MALRLPVLDTRPFHTDEANNAFILQELLQGRYTYRLHDHHGPTLFYLLGGALAPFGITTVAAMEAWHLRALPLVLGLLLAATPFAFRPLISLRSAVAGSAWLLLLPAFVYYGGIAIHELLLVNAVALYTVALWHGIAIKRMHWPILAGLAAGVALGTKETAAPILGLITLAAIFTLPAPKRAWLQILGIIAAVTFVVTWLLYAQGGRTPESGFDLFRAVKLQVARGTGAEHAHPWYTYLAWSFAPSSVGLPWGMWAVATLAGYGTWRGRKMPLVRFLAASTVLLALFFSALSYKTPWLMLVWLWPAALLAGLGAGSFPETGRKYGVLGLAVLGLTAWEAYAKCVQHPVDPGNPLAYSPSSDDLPRLVADLEEAMTTAPEGADTIIQVVARDYWPLPWTLRRFPQVGYWSEPITLYPPAIALLGPEVPPTLPPPIPDLRQYTLRPGVFIFLRQPTP